MKQQNTQPHAITSYVSLAFKKYRTALLCRTPFNNGVALTEFSDDEPESESESESDYEILDYNHAMVEAAYRGSSSPC